MREYVRDNLGRFAFTSGGGSAAGKAVSSATVPGGTRTSIPSKPDMKALDSQTNLNAQVRDPDGVRVKGVGDPGQFRSTSMSQRPSSPRMREQVSKAMDRGEYKIAFEKAQAQIAADGDARLAARNSATQPGGSRTSIPNPNQEYFDRLAASSRADDNLQDYVDGKAYAARNAAGQTIRKRTRMDADAIRRGDYSW
jgi:hypothetical protein